MECKICSKKFNQYRPYNVFCSYRCSDAARYYRDKEKRLEKDKKYYQNNKEKSKEKSRLSKERYPEKWKARQDLRNAVYRGDIKKKPCKKCKNPIVQAHHPDYSKPFDVIWLCGKHHMELHRKYKSISPSLLTKSDAKIT